MINLDDAQVFQRLDPGGMLGFLHEMPRQFQQAWEMAAGFDLPDDYADIDEVVVLGMGSSAIGAELVSGLVAPEAKLPIFICRDYSLPAFVDARTLVIASSYSGMTEETISSFQQALKTEAKKMAITTGGRLKTIAARAGVPVFSFDYKAQPRVAIGFSFMAVLGSLQKLGFISDQSTDVAEAVLTLEELAQEIGEKAALSRNPAKQLAGALYGRLAVIYGAGILSGVARRWKTQLNENSKSWAFYELSPELNHNAVVGYKFPPDLADKAVVVLLRSAFLPKTVRASYQVVCRLLEQDRVAYQIVEGRGKSRLSQMMSLLLFGDYLSYYLAILNQTDPTPISSISYLKGELTKG